METRTEIIEITGRVLFWKVREKGQSWEEKDGDNKNYNTK